MLTVLIAVKEHIINTVALLCVYYVVNQAGLPFCFHSMLAGFSMGGTGVLA